jgi:hypothetical protein
VTTGGNITSVNLKLNLHHLSKSSTLLSSFIMPMTYSYMDTDWPVLDKASPVSISIVDDIKFEANGAALSRFLGHFSVGFFFISTDLLEAHPVQRPVDNAHVHTLINEFKRIGINRADSSGVVIGLGPGWKHMKNTGPKPYMITNACRHLPHLALSNGGPIAQVLRGGHRTIAIKRHAQTITDTYENYWFYNVLLPGLF